MEMKAPGPFLRGPSFRISIRGFNRGPKRLPIQPNIADNSEPFNYELNNWALTSITYTWWIDATSPVPETYHHPADTPPSALPLITFFGGGNFFEAYTPWVEEAHRVEQHQREN